MALSSDCPGRSRVVSRSESRRSVSLGSCRFCGNGGLGFWTGAFQGSVRELRVLRVQQDGSLDSDISGVRVYRDVAPFAAIADAQGEIVNDLRVRNVLLLRHCRHRRS